MTARVTDEELAELHRVSFVPRATPNAACRNCGIGYETAAADRPCPKPSPGTPFIDCGKGGHYFDQPLTWHQETATTRALAELMERRSDDQMLCEALEDETKHLDDNDVPHEGPTWLASVRNGILNLIGQRDEARSRARQLKVLHMELSQVRLELQEALEANDQPLRKLEDVDDATSDGTGR